MNTETILNIGEDHVNTLLPKIIPVTGRHTPPDQVPEILFITSYPPRECGIATYSQDLLKALNNKFTASFSLKVCALESGHANHNYPEEVKYVLDTSDSSGYALLAKAINDDPQINLVLVQHEFGFFQQEGKNAFLQLLYGITKPVVLVFHTVLPHPDETLYSYVRHIASACEAVIVMTKNSAKLLREDYGIPNLKIIVIPHGTHLVPHLNKDGLKDKFGLSGRKVLSTFGLLSSGKGIGLTLDSLPEIIKLNPDVIFLIIGKTHPGVIKSEGEKYRDMLEAKVENLNLHHHVKFINRYLPLQDLLEYLQMTDIYLFTSTDPNQAVSGTFSYALSCGCPIISTPIPHAREVLRKHTGIIIDFDDAQQLVDGVIRLMNDEPLRTAFRSSTLQRIVPTAWENSAIAHAMLLQKLAGIAHGAGARASIYRSTTAKRDPISLQYRLPEIKLAHLKKMTTTFGILQFSKINEPDIESGYTLDDNARALVAMCMHYAITADKADLDYIRTYLEFIRYCQQPGGDFLNYVDFEQRFTDQNGAANLADANGRAVWALGFLISKGALLPAELIETAENVLNGACPYMATVHSTRAMAFAIKGLYYCNLAHKSPERSALINTLGHRMVQMYRHESDEQWQWYENSLTYANSILPEAMLCAWQDTGEPIFKETAKVSFDFLLSLTFKGKAIKVISNKGWLHRNREAVQVAIGGEQPIDVAYTILAMKRFYRVFKEEGYLQKMTTAFSWFLGNNHLNQIVYNPCTGGCYDGLEESNVNLNQGAESTVSYLMARLTL